MTGRSLGTATLLALLLQCAASAASSEACVASDGTCTSQRGSEEGDDGSLSQLHSAKVRIHQHGKQEKLDEDSDVLTVLNTNAFLMEISKKPNLLDRRDGYIEWFERLTPEEVPDVVVLLELFSDAGESVVKKLCTSAWKRNSPGFKNISCSSQSHFEEATAIVNARTSVDPMTDGGVVVLVKRGISVVSADDQAFGDSAGADKMSFKGFWALQISKGDQKYWVCATHTQAYDGSENVAIRKKQFTQMRSYMDRHGTPNDRLVFVGDMNIFTIPVEGNVNETDGMLEALGAPGVPASGGELVPEGFWRPLDSKIYSNVEVEHNHYIYYDANETKFGDQRFDWVVVPGAGDTFQAPTQTKVQFVPMKKPHGCFKSQMPGATKTYTDDLSDHYAIFAEICYGSTCPSLPQLTAAGEKVLPSGPDCEGLGSTWCYAGSRCPGLLSHDDFKKLLDNKKTQLSKRSDYSGRCLAPGEGSECGPRTWPNFLRRKVFCKEGQVCECNMDGNKCVTIPE